MSDKDKYYDSGDQADPVIEQANSETNLAVSTKADNDTLNDDAKEGIAQTSAQKTNSQSIAKEVGGPRGLEPTRYGDWESKGRCYDF